jgi:hypothetical protein
VLTHLQRLRLAEEWAQRAAQARMIAERLAPELIAVQLADDVALAAFGAWPPSPDLLERLDLNARTVTAARELADGLGGAG